MPSTTLNSQFSDADNDLRQKICQALESVIQPVNFHVAVNALCSKGEGDFFKINISSALLPNWSKGETFNKQEIQTLGPKWQRFSKEVAQDFVKGPLKFRPESTV